MGTLVRQANWKEGRNHVKCSLAGEEHLGQWSQGKLSRLATEGGGEWARGQVMKGWTHLAKSVNLTLCGMKLLNFNPVGYTES